MKAFDARNLWLGELTTNGASPWTNRNYTGEGPGPGHGLRNSSSHDRQPVQPPIAISVRRVFGYFTDISFCADPVGAQHGRTALPRPVRRRHGTHGRRRRRQGCSDQKSGGRTGACGFTPLDDFEPGIRGHHAVDCCTNVPLPLESGAGRTPQQHRRRPGSMKTPTDTLTRSIA